MTSTATPPELKTEAARSLIERLYEKTALVRLFRFNAAMKHGVPIKDREIEITPAPTPAVAAPAPQPVESATQATVRRETVEQPATTPCAAPSEPWWKGWLLPASLLGAGALATGGGYLASRPATTDTQHTEHTERIETIMMHESPLQYIEDQGGHLP